MQAVVLAGGKGTRLKPFTNAIPKPLVPLGDLPILEIVLRQLRYHGVTDVVLAVNHLARLIQAFFGDGNDLGLRLTYSVENQPLGTAGPLRLLDHLEDNFLVMNGDLLTTIDFRDLYGFHTDASATATIATYKKEVKIDLGVLEIEHDRFLNYTEKPTYRYDVSTGIYAFSRKVLAYIPAEQKFDMPALMLALSAAGEPVRCYSGDYEWLDIGRVEDYERAIEAFESARSRYLPE